MDAASSAPKDPAAKLHVLVLDPLLRRATHAGSTRTADIARHLTHAGHRVSVLTTTAAGAVSEIRDSVDVTAVRTPEPARFGFGYPQSTCRRFARAAAWRIWGFAQVDAVITTDRPVMALPMTMIFCAARGIPLLLEARAGFAARPAAAPLGQRLWAWIERATLKAAARRAHQIVAFSREIKDGLTGGGVDETKIVVSAPGCDTTLFAPPPPGTDNALLAANPHLARGPLAVYVGTMVNAERMENILALAAAMQSVDSRVRFLLCGDGPAQARIDMRARELGVLEKNLWLLDPLARKDLPPLLDAATVTVAADDSASLLFDSLAAGKPVALTAGGWRREMIESRGAGIGLPTDPAAAARELADYLKDTDGLRRASQQASAMAAGRFNLERIAAEVRGLVESSVAADPRAAVMRRRTLKAKRALDVLISLVGLIVLSPALLILALAVRTTMGAPVFFAQTRTGLKGRLFKAYKFRTMTDAADATGALLPDGQRLTSFGRFLRRTSLDQLPELFHVLKGDMSLVGPRPLLPEYLPFYSPEQKRRHDLSPGMTGWSQVNGRNATTWEERFAQDVWYVDNVSLWLDLKIMLKTVWVAISGDGVSAPGHATMPRFDEIMARSQGAEDV